MAKFTKNEVLDIIYGLADEVQSMREEGDTDLRTVLHRIDIAIRDIGKLDDDK